MKVTIWEYLITMMLTTGEYLILTIFLGILLFLTCRPVHKKVWEYVTVVAHKLESAIWWYNDILLRRKYLYFSLYLSYIFFTYDFWFFTFRFYLCDGCCSPALILLQMSSLMINNKQIITINKSMFWVSLLNLNLRTWVIGFFTCKFSVNISKQTTKGNFKDWYVLMK